MPSSKPRKRRLANLRLVRLENPWWVWTIAKTNKQIVTDALRWQNFDDIIRAFFDLERLLYMKDSKLYQAEIRHIRKYGVIALVVITEQFCREAIKMQTGARPVKPSLWNKLFRKEQGEASDSDALRNFQNVRIIAKILGKYGITGIFDGKNGDKLRQNVKKLIFARHDAVHTVSYTKFDVLDGHKMLEILFRRILDLSVLENSSDIDIARAGYELDNDNPDEAGKIMRVVIHTDGKSNNILYNKGVAWNRLEMHERAITYLEELVAVAPDEHKAWIQMGLAFGGLGQMEKEIECYNRVLRLRPDDMNALANACVALTKTGQKAESNLYLERIQSLEPNDPIDLFYKGMALGALNIHKDALECFEKALVARPDDPRILYSKGAALVDLERYEEALECFNGVLEAWHGNKKALFAKAGTFESMGRYEESSECHRQIESQNE